jgi:hypothetical protein
MNTLPTTCVQDLDAIRATLGEARLSLKKGIMPNMFGLDQRIAEVCKRIEGADEAIQQECLPLLSILLNDLDECENDVRKWQEAQSQGGGGR